MKGYYKIKVPVYKQSGLVPDTWTSGMYEKFPYIYLSHDFTHYLSKWLQLINVKGTVGGLVHRGFRTHYIIERDKVITKVRDTRLARKVLGNTILKIKDGWIYTLNEEVKLG